MSASKMYRTTFTTFLAVHGAVWVQLIHASLEDAKDICWPYFDIIFKSTLLLLPFVFRVVAFNFAQYTISLSSWCRGFWMHWICITQASFIRSSVSESKIQYILSAIFLPYMRISADPFLFWWLKLNLYCILLSSFNRKNETLVIVFG